MSRPGTLVLVVARDGERIVGCAGLVAAKSENSNHRAEVIKVLVLRSHRRRGHRVRAAVRR